MKRGVIVGLALSSLVIVGVLGAQLSLQPTGRALTAGAPAIPAQGFPRPEDIVNVDSADSPSVSSTSPPNALVPFGTSLPIFTVPSGKYLIVTQWRCAGANFFALVEDNAGALTTKLNTFYTLTANNVPQDFSPIGLVFQPGSIVALRNLHPTNDLNVAFTFIGYLVDA